VSGNREAAVEIERGADQREVGKGLREVAEVLGAWPQFLAIQSEVIRVAEHLLEEKARLLHIPHSGETLDVPERTHRECALLTAEPVREAVTKLVAVDEGIADQVAFDAAERTGQVEMSSVLRAALAAGTSLYYVEDESADPWGHIPQSLRYLESFER
jgi:hypothetical protein